MLQVDPQLAVVVVLQLCEISIKISLLNCWPQTNVFTLSLSVLILVGCTREIAGHRHQRASAAANPLSESKVIMEL